MELCIKNYSRFSDWQSFDLNVDVSICTRTNMPINGAANNILQWKIEKLFFRFSYYALKISLTQKSRKKDITETS